MIAHTAKVMPILSSVLVLMGFFLTSCVGINLRDIPRGLRHPRVPSVDPSTLGWKTLYALAYLKYCYITLYLPYRQNIPWDDCPYSKGNANTFVRARAFRVFPDLVCQNQPRSENPIHTLLPEVLLQ